MDRIFENSSAIARVTYTPTENRTGRLMVEFHGGRAYCYDVPWWVPGLLVSGTSVGKAYNRIMRPWKGKGVRV